jgi:integrase
LRSCDIAALKLDDIDWRGGHIRIAQRKGGSPLSLPLSDEVGAALLSYLRRGRPKLACREVFLRCRAPAGVLKPTAVTEAFQGWSRRSGLKIPFQGPHCLRHSYAVHLLRRGVSLKTIGDVLGHRSAEATCMYLRLSIEDLRDVALAVPKEIGASRPQEFEP